MIINTRSRIPLTCLGFAITLSVAGCTPEIPKAAPKRTVDTPAACIVIDAEGTPFPLSPTQARHAATISAVAQTRDMPVQAAKIAVATAMQESSLRNIDHGDRDSLGLFQQRPSQGWGTPDELQDPIYASNAFYDALDKVPGYAELALTVAAQKVQRSAYPDAYAKHEPMAAAWTSALSGDATISLTCSFPLTQTVGTAAQISAHANRDFGTALTVMMQVPGSTTGEHTPVPPGELAQQQPAEDSQGVPVEGAAPAPGPTTLETITLDTANLAKVLRRDEAEVNEAVARWSVAQAYELGVTSVTTAAGQQWTPRGKWTDVSITNPGSATPGAVTVVIVAPMPAPAQ